MDLEQTLAWKALRGANQGWPEATVDVGDLPLHDATDENVAGLSNATGELKDFVASTV